MDLVCQASSVIKFLKNRIKNFKVWDDKKEKYLRAKYTTKNLKKTLKQVDYIVLTPGISLIKILKLNMKKNNY